MTAPDSTPQTPQSSEPADPPESPRSARAAWFSRLAGLGMLTEQSASHALGKGSDLILVGAGLMLLAGKEGIEFMRMILGRESP